MSPLWNVPYRWRSVDDADPVVEVVFRPWGGTGAQYRAQALVDSGASFSFVPFGVATDRGWLPGTGDRVRYGSFGGAREGEPFRVIATVKGNEFALTVVEMSEDSDLPYEAVLGRDFMRHYDLLFSGSALALTADNFKP